MKAIKRDTTAYPRWFDSGAARFWSPELRRAVMKVRPEYFSWPLEQRAGYGVAIPKRDAASLDKALLRELFGKSYATRKEASAAAGRLSLDDQDRWHETVLPLHGIGEDCFYLNESFAKNKNILDFDTVRAFDESDYRFQEKARRKEDPDYCGKPYRGSLYLHWARLYFDATLSMAAGYIEITRRHTTSRNVTIELAQNVPAQARLGLKSVQREACLLAVSPQRAQSCRREHPRARSRRSLILLACERAGSHGARDDAVPRRRWVYSIPEQEV